MKALNYYSSERSDILKLVPKSVKKVLEVGCGTGMTGKAVKNMTGAHVTGIEIVSEMAEEANKNLDVVIKGDIEKLKLPFQEGQFDCILYGDVLEHLIDPWGVLKNVSKFLGSGGYAILSVPNIAHYRIFKMLWRKEWNYEEMGILDSTHLRFFALNNIKKMISDAGLEILTMDRNISASKSKKFFNNLFRNALIDYLTEQYIILCRKESKSA